MHDDVTTFYDLALISVICVLTWFLDRFVKTNRDDSIGRVRYYITPVGGHRFYWRRSYEKEEEHAA